MMNLKIENILKKCSTYWTEPQKPTIMKIEKARKKWNFYDSMRCMVEWSREQGMNIIPIITGTKKPAVKWKEYQKRHATDEEIEKWFFDYLKNASFGLQFNTFMAHYLRHRLLEEWYDDKKEKWTDETTWLLHNEPWCYREWFRIFPDSAEELYRLLISRHFNEFVKEHLQKKFTWGWTKLFNKEKPMLINLTAMLAHAQEDAKQYREGLETCRFLLEDLKKFWLQGYPSQLRMQAKNNITIGDIAFAWLIENKDKKLTAVDAASMLKMNVMTVRRRIMPNIKKLEPLLKLLGIQIAHRGEG